MVKQAAAVHELTLKHNNLSRHALAADRRSRSHRPTRPEARARRLADLDAIEADVVKQQRERRAAEAAQVRADPQRLNGYQERGTRRSTPTRAVSHALLRIQPRQSRPFGATIG